MSKNPSRPANPTKGPEPTRPIPPPRPTKTSKKFTADERYRLAVKTTADRIAASITQEQLDKVAVLLRPSAPPLHTSDRAA